MIEMRIGGGLLGRHVGRRSQSHAHRRHIVAPGCLADRFRHTEVRHQGVLAAHQHVVRLYVAMNNTLRMREGECVRDIVQDAHRVADRKCTLALQARPYGFTLDVRHDIVQQPVGGARVVHREDVRMLEIGGGPDFSREPVHAECFSELRPEDLYRDRAIVPEIAGKVDGRRAAFTELALDVIAVVQGTAKTGEDGVGQRPVYLLWRRVAACKVPAGLERGNTNRRDLRTPAVRLLHEHHSSA